MSWCAYTARIGGTCLMQSACRLWLVRPSYPAWIQPRKTAGWSAWSGWWPIRGLQSPQPIHQSPYRESYKTWCYSALTNSIWKYTANFQNHRDRPGSWTHVEVNSADTTEDFDRNGAEVMLYWDPPVDISHLTEEQKNIARKMLYAESLAFAHND